MLSSVIILVNLSQLVQLLFSQVSVKASESMPDEGNESHCEEDHFLYTQVTTFIFTGFSKRIGVNA